MQKNSFEAAAAGCTSDSPGYLYNQTPSPNLSGKEGYGAGMQRQEVQPGWAKGKKVVVVVPVVNVEAQLGRSLGENGPKPAISW